MATAEVSDDKLITADILHMHYYTQKEKQVLDYLGYLYHDNKTYLTKDTRLMLWECERRRDSRCSVYVTTDEDGCILLE